MVNGYKENSAKSEASLILKLAKPEYEENVEATANGQMTVRELRKSVIKAGSGGDGDNERCVSHHRFHRFPEARLNEAASRQTLSRVWCQRCM